MSPARSWAAAAVLALTSVRWAVAAEPQPNVIRRPAMSGQAGLASWYGGKFHGRQTASGEPFDQHALTAAHPTLPFGTILNVTNLDNGRRVSLRVNDRGPYVGGRVIDCSAAAADQLGFRSTGLACVLLEVVPETTSDACARGGRRGAATP